MTKFKKTIKRIFHFLGFKIIKSKGAFSEISLDIIKSNFDNLCLNYESFFSKEFGEISANLKRRDLMMNLRGTPPSEAYFIISSLEKTKNVSGDVCEFGVAQGSTSALIANEITNNNKLLHLYDSFEGLPAPTEKDTLKDDIFNLGSIESYKGTMSNPVNLVLNKLKSISFQENRIIIHKGFIEELIANKENFPRKVSFAFVDFDFYEPIKIALEFLNNVTDKGAIIIIDDYDFFSTGAKSAVDEFLENNSNRYDLFVPSKSFGYFAILTKK